MLLLEEDEEENEGSPFKKALSRDLTFDAEERKNSLYMTSVSQLESDPLATNGRAQNNTRLKVQLFISCRDLVNVDYVGKTDSLVAFYTKSTHHHHAEGKKTTKWVKTDQTEVI